jgi:hypothetical protein
MRLRVLLLAFTLIPVVAAAQAADPLAGAWERTGARNLTTGQPQPQAPVLHVIFSNGHYVQFGAAANRAKLAVPRDKMTREQLLERGDMQGQYGTYRVDGNKLTRRIISAADPNNEGRDAAQEFKVDGDVLTITNTNQQGQKVETRFRRLR